MKGIQKISGASKRLTGYNGYLQVIMLLDSKSLYFFDHNNINTWAPLDHWDFVNVLNIYKPMTQKQILKKVKIFLKKIEVDK